jgi:hypothetical protein
MEHTLGCRDAVAAASCAIKKIVAPSFDTEEIGHFR